MHHFPYVKIKFLKFIAKENQKCFQVPTLEYPDCCSKLDMTFLLNDDDNITVIPRKKIYSAKY